MKPTSAYTETSTIWIGAAEFLSLDFVRPVYGDLDTRVPCQESLRGILRDGLSGRIDANALGLIDAFELPMAPGKIAECLRTFRRAFGPAQMESLMGWMLYVYRYDENPWVPYEAFFSRWAAKIRHGEKDNLDLGQEIAQHLAIELRDVISTADVEQRLLPFEPSRLSEWDRVLFDEQGLNELPDHSRYVPFLDLACVSIRMARFQRWFGGVLDAVPTSTIERLEAAVQAEDLGGETFVTVADLPRRIAFER